MLSWFSSRQTPLAFALYDGASWRVRIFHHHHGQWHAEGAEGVASRNGKRIPPAVLDFAARADARRVRVLLPGDLHAVTLELPEDAENEEVHTALVYEAAEQRGVDAHMLRIAAVRADRFRMGGDGGMILTAGFETKLIDAFAQDCEKAGLVFEGVGSLEMSLLARHARLNEAMRLLFLRRQNALYAVPAFDAAPFSLSAVPLGGEEDDSESGRERTERTAKRFEAHRHLPIRVVSAEPIPERRRESLRALLGTAEEVEFSALPDLEEEMLRHAAWAAVGGAEAGCALVGPPPPPRDPHRAGTVVCFLTLAATALYVGARGHGFRRELDAARARESAWKTLEDARKKAKEELASLNARHQSLLARQTLLAAPVRFPAALAPVLDTLALDTPRYSRITEIAQGKNGAFTLRGVTRWQEGLGLLNDAFLRRGLTCNLTMEAETADGDQTFSFTVSLPGGAP